MRLLATPPSPLVVRCTIAIAVGRARPSRSGAGVSEPPGHGPDVRPTWLFLSLIPGGVGFVLFVYGKKQERWPQLAAGIAFMVYPYFTDTVTALIVVGAVLGAALWLAVRSGW